MGYAEPASQNNNTELRMLHGVHMLCMSLCVVVKRATARLHDAWCQLLSLPPLSIRAFGSGPPLHIR